MNRFALEIEVAPEHLDQLLHVNNVQYLEWVQQVAREHWNTLTRPEWEADFAWVVRSHEIEYLKSAALGDRLRVETYVPELRGPFSVRITEFTLPGADSRIATCRTRWCLLKKPGFSPARIPDSIKAVF